jgi:2-hydroxychromene-2-carboxylate isomerase
VTDTRAPIPVQFFYGIGSRYSYLASTQMLRLEAETGCQVAWRPLYSADLFQARRADPFAGAPVSGQYDWSYRRFDAECWADYYGVAYREPEGLAFDPARLALACMAAGRLGVGKAFSRRLFHAIFVERRSPIDDAVCGVLAVESGLSRADFERMLDDSETARQLAATVRDALDLGVFGVPSFVIDGRVYFGNDRLPIVRHVLHKMQGRHGRSP